MIEGRIRAYLDDELGVDERASVEDVLDRTVVEELESIERVVSEQLALIDPVDRTEAALASVQSRLAAGHRRTHPVRFLSRAAAIVLITLGAGATGLLGSPVQGWILRGWERVSLLWQEESSSDAAESAPQVPGPSGIQMQPADGRLSVALESVPTDAELKVRMVDAERGWVYAAAGSGFDTEPGEVRVDLLDRSGDVVIEVARSIPTVVVTMNGMELLRKTGDEITILVNHEMNDEGEWTFSGALSGR